jgi:predicted lipoprotein with Yx(FWY)xxD motif
LVAGCGSSSPKKTTSATAAAPASAPAAPKAAAHLRVRQTSLGRIVVDGAGRTLYMFAGDRSGKTTCTGMCVKFWLPYTTGGKPTAGPGIHASLLGTTPGAGGANIVTYHGHPLYHFLKDKKAGQSSGEDVTAFGARWDALSPAGSRVTKPKPKPATSSSGASAPATTQSTTTTVMHTTPPPTVTHTTPPPTVTHTAPPPPTVTHNTPPPPTTTHKTTPPPPSGGGIPQGGGGDGDADNNGGPSDGDGSI